MEQFNVDDIKQVRKQHPDAIILAHPECPPDVVKAADYSGSTSRMIRMIQENDAGQYFLQTECSMTDNIISENPDKDLLRLCNICCPHMQEITLEQTRDALLKE